ncbi:unnamed protein product [Oikopleura dioica]|uniref:Eukaryotic translation initiation factor 4E-binding protein 1 n=1 Tax=Oikopleura dioica TaxID=34765 RepID=E4XA59_OIKDI|nr:unnamed protein product [Oikopleura dioica]
MSSSKPIRRLQIKHENELPSDAAATPGGTLFGTTPGGSKIIYDRLYLMRMKSSPASNTPPKGMTPVRGITLIPEAIYEGAGDSAKKHAKSIPEATAEELEKSNADNDITPADDMEL